MCSSLLANQNSKFRLFLRLVRTNRFAVWSAAQTLLPLLCGYRSGSCSSRRHLIVCGCYSVGTCYSRGLNAFVFSSELRDIDFLRSRLHPSCLYSSSSSHSRPQCFLQKPFSWLGVGLCSVQPVVFVLRQFSSNTDKYAVNLQRCSLSPVEERVRLFMFAETKAQF